MTTWRAAVDVCRDSRGNALRDVENATRGIVYDATAREQDEIRAAWGEAAYRTARRRDMQAFYMRQRTEDACDHVRDFDVGEAIFGVGQGDES